MKLFAEKLDKTHVKGGLREAIYIVKDADDSRKTVGLLTKYANTKTEEHPWKLFIYEGEFIPGETEAKFIVATFSKKISYAHDYLLTIAAETLRHAA